MAFEFDAYEIRADIIPGAMLLLGLFIVFPGLQGYLKTYDVSFAGLTLLVILAFVLGSVLRAVGEALGSVYWWLRGGMPSDWIAKDDRLLGEPARADLLKALHEDGILEAEAWPDEEGWRGVAERMAARARNAGKPGRLETFLGNYGLYRGLAAAFLVLFLLVGLLNLANAPWLFDMDIDGLFVANASFVMLLLALALVLAGVGMERAGRSYAKELAAQYLEAARPAPAKAA